MKRAAIEALTELQADLGEGLVTDADIVESYRSDQATSVRAGTPMALARPSCTAEVQALARWATRHRVALVPRGAGTGVAGGASASDGCVTVSFERMSQILAIDEASMTAVVQPGVINKTLKDAARDRGLWYPPDPSSYDISTLGGNVATNAGGLCCVKYGVTGDYVLGLEAVMADGQIVRCGGRTRKDVAGYDLTHLFIGSEGTLAMITEITLRLRRKRPPQATLVAVFTSLEDSGRAVAGIVRSVDASLLELMDRAAIRAVESHAALGLDVDAAALLIAQTDADASTDLERMRCECEAAGASLVLSTDDESEGQRLSTARRLALPALERLGTVLVGDVAVPVPLLPEMLRRVATVAARSDVTVGTVAHAGDGNLHPLVVFDGRDAAAEGRAAAVYERLMGEALELGGTITGEHGVGTVKREFLPRQLGSASLAVHRTIKSALDPIGILNPGKVIPSS